MTPARPIANLTYFQKSKTAKWNYANKNLVNSESDEPLFWLLVEMIGNLAMLDIDMAVSHGRL